MKKIFLKLMFSSALVIGLLISKNADSQTTGTFSFTVNPVSHTGYDGTKHYVAIWVENISTTFIKTKLVQADNHGKNNHLLVWKAKSNSNTVDAFSGPSLSTYAPITIEWNGTDVPAALVPDGDYKVWIECTWNHGTSNTSTTSVQFTKGPNVVSLTPPNTTNFTGMSLTWTPTNVGTGEMSSKDGISLYPNPSKGIVNIDFKQSFNGKIQIMNFLGAKVFEENIENTSTGIKTFNLHKYANGAYFVNIRNNNSNEVTNFKVVLNK